MTLLKLTKSKLVYSATENPHLTGGCFYQFIYELFVCVTDGCLRESDTNSPPPGAGVFRRARWQSGGEPPGGTHVGVAVRSPRPGGTRLHQTGEILSLSAFPLCTLDTSRLTNQT